MENKLNKWFDAAKHNPPMISTKEVGAMISNPPAVKGRLSTLKKTVFMGTIFLIITSWLYWMNVSAPFETSIQKETTQQSEIVVGDTLKTLAESDHSNKQLFIKEENKQSQVQYGSESTDYNDVELEYPLNHTGGVGEEQNEELQFQHPILFLDSKELEVLDIKIEKGSYNYYYKTYSYQSTIKATQLKSVNDSFFFAKGFPGKNYFIKPWETDFYPLYLTDSLGNDQRNFHFQDKRDSQSWAEFNDSLAHHFRVTYQHLIPIAIRTPDLGRLEILWYKPTKALIKKLPARYAVLFNEGGYSSNRNWGNGESKKSDEKMIDLTNEELAALGIFTDGNVLRYLTQSDTTVYHFDFNPKPSVFAFSIKVEKSGGISSNNIHEQDAELKKLSNSVVPALISINQIREGGKESFMIAEQNTIPFGYRTEFIQRIKEDLVPIKVLTRGISLMDQHDNEIVFWYKNNDTFWQKLPEWARVKARQHYPHFNEVKYGRLIADLKQKDERDNAKHHVTANDIETSEATAIDLTPKELRKLNIRFDGKFLSYQMMSQRLDSSYVIIDLIVTPDNFSLNTRGKTGKATKYKSNKNYPWYITDTLLGISQNFVDPLGTDEENDQRLKDMDRMFKERLPDMIPVRIRFDTKAVRDAKYKHPQTILLFWFPETETFMKALPQRIQKQKNLISPK